MLSNLSIGVVLYSPECNVIDMLRTIQLLGCNLYIYNNGIDKDFEHDMKSVLTFPNVTLLGDGTNSGLAIPINQMAKLAIKQNKSHLLFLDQDTLVNKSLKSSLENVFNSSLLDDNYTTLQILSENDSRYLKNIEIVDVLFNINSGTIFNLNKMREVGYQNESFFVECVDYEFCLRSRYFGYKVGLINGLNGLDHFSNQDDNKYNFLNQSFKVRIYSALRLKEFNKGHVKILIKSLSYFDFSSSFVILKSYFLFNIKNNLSKFLAFIGKKNEC